MSLFKKFKNDRRGNFAIMTALACPLLIAAVAFGIDVSNHLRTGTELQDANDTAVLFAAKFYQQNRHLPTNTQVLSYLEANTAFSVINPTVSINPTTEEVTVTSEMLLRPLLMGYFGNGQKTVGALSKAMMGVNGILEFSLALDVTGSMKYDGRIGGLKTAATNFVDLLFDAKDRGADVKGSIVPFSRYVNVGLSRRNESWMNVPPDIDTRQIETTCTMQQDVVSQTNCNQTCTQAQTINHPAVNINHPAQTINHPAVPPTCTVDDGQQVCSGGTPAWTETTAAWTQNDPAWTENIPASCGTTCQPVYGPEYEVCTQFETGELIEWHGCVGSRPHPWNLKDEDPSLRFPGPLGVTCNAELLPLTDNRNGLLARIDALTPYDETYIPDGVMWGLRTLTPQVPFNEGLNPATSNAPLRKALVVMTDGMNTLSPDGQWHIGTDSTLSNQYTLAACDEAKSKDVEVYTITFGTSVPNQARVMMKKCASNNNQYYNAASSADLNRAFQDIADNLLMVRLSH